jgi:UDP-N-acetylglucosamine:LPS N-acetylglucosamine transferase
MKTLMVILGSGGHTNQMLRLVDSLGAEYRYEYAVAKGDELSPKKIKIKGRISKIYDLRKKEDKNVLKVFFKSIASFIDSISILSRSKADAIIACGPGMSIPLCIIGKIIFRKKIIFLESWSRVYSKSISGKMVYPLADLFFVQWQEELKNYPKAKYSGRLG